MSCGLNKQDVETPRVGLVALFIMLLCSHSQFKGARQLTTAGLTPGGLLSQLALSLRKTQQM